MFRQLMKIFVKRCIVATLLFVMSCFSIATYATESDVNNNININIENNTNQFVGNNKDNVNESNIDNGNKSDKAVYSLKEIAGYKSDDEIIDELDSDEVAKSMLNGFLHELKPYLKGVIDESVTDEHVFSSSEAIKIISSHPLKFLTAIYNYVVNSFKEIFSIAEENAGLVIE